MTPPREARLTPPCAGADAPILTARPALLLVESLIHGLIARGVLSVVDAVEIMDIAAEVKTELADEPGVAPAATDASISRLRAISTSLRYDLPPE